MVCARCGASNAETALLCGNCGASLQKQPANTSTFVNRPGQSFASHGEDMSAHSIDELPTAHLPSVSGASNFASAAPIPFGQAFPLEIEQNAADSQQPVGDPTIAAPSSQFALTPQPFLPASDPRLALPNIADYPASTSVPITPATPPAVSSSAVEQAASSTPGTGPVLPLGKLSLPSRLKTSTPPSQPGLNKLFSPPITPTPPDIAGQPAEPNASGQLGMSRPPSQPNLGQHLGPGGQLAQPNLGQHLGLNGQPVQSNASGQLGMSRPPSQPNLGQQAGLNGQPAQFNPYGAQGGAKPPSQAGMYPPQAQMGAGGQGQYAGERNYQAQPTPEPLGGNYPGPLEREEMRRPASPRGADEFTPEEMNKFVRPLPLWVRLSSLVVGVLLLFGLIFLHSDWATGTIIAGIVALVLAILLGIAAGVRVALGMLKTANTHRRAQVINTVLLILLLLLFSGIGLSQQSRLHLVQGRYLENQQNWSVAIQEYQTAGERSSASVDVARTYNAWGEAQSKQQQYAGAVTSFTAVIKNYQDTANEFKRAQTDILVAYLAWADQASQRQDYAGATAHYNALLALIFCDTNNCANFARPKDATAYYHLAEQLLAQHQYTQAVDAYQILTSRFPKAPEVGQIHAHYAQALWGKGQQQLNTTCSSALATYRLLAQLFADTREGQQAAGALMKTVVVKGHFTQSVPGAPYHPTAFLVQGLTADIQQYQFSPLLAHAPTATIHSDGSFTFSGVPPGTYELVWSSDTLHYYYSYSGKRVFYVAKVGSLCAFDYGAVNQAIPTK